MESLTRTWSLLPPKATVTRYYPGPSSRQRPLLQGTTLVPPHAKGHCYKVLPWSLLTPKATVTGFYPGPSSRQRPLLQGTTLVPPHAKGHCYRVLPWSLLPPKATVTGYYPGPSSRQRPLLQGTTLLAWSMADQYLVTGCAQPPTQATVSRPHSLFSQSHH